LNERVGTSDARLSIQIAGVDARVEGAQHAANVNHYKIMGRIDQVTNMLAEHMANMELHQPASDHTAD